MSRTGLALAALLLLAARASAGAFPGENGLIAYLTVPATPSALNEIGVMNPDGSDAHAITTLGKRLSPPAWSATGGKLAFFAVDATQTVLYTADADGSNLDPVFSTGPGNADNAGPSWSPDGTKVAVALGAGIYVTEIATGGSTQVASNPSATHTYDQPEWSPTGDRIAVRIRRQGGGIYNFQHDVGVLPATGGVVTNLTQNRNPDGSDGDAGCQLEWPSWSPDGTTIVYSYGPCQRPEEPFPGGGPSARINARLATVHATQGTLTLLTPMFLLDQRLLRNPAFSPAGDEIVMEYAGQETVFGLARMPAAVLPPLLTGLTVYPGLLARAPDWQPVEPATALAASLVATPGSIGVGDRFTVTMTARNVAGDDLTDVRPVGPLTLEGTGAAEVASGPVPASVATLVAGGTQAFVYELDSTVGGSLVVKGRVQAMTPEGDTVTATARCGVGEGAALRVRGAVTADEPAPPVCRADGGAEVEIVPCTFELVDISPPRSLDRLSGDHAPPPGTETPPGGT